jgi:uncharacterized protein
MPPTNESSPRWSAREIMAVLAEKQGVLREMGVRRLGLFGSYRRGDATPDSDIDLLVVLARPSFDDYMDVRFYLEDLFGRKVDLVLEKALKPRIRPYILQEVEYAPGL